MRSWLDLRRPTRLSWKMVNFTPESSAAFDEGFEPAARVGEQSGRQLVALFAAHDRLLQRIGALRTLERIELQAPVDGLEQFHGVAGRLALGQRHQRLELHALVGARRRAADDAGVHARADAVQIAPRAELVA